MIRIATELLVIFAIFQPIEVVATALTKIGICDVLVSDTGSELPAEIFLRDVNQTEVPQVYIENIKTALIRNFGPWLRGANSSSYLAMLRQMHRDTTQGPTESYTGIPGPFGKMSMEEVFPGKFRFERHEPETYAPVTRITEESFKEFSWPIAVVEQITALAKSNTPPDISNRLARIPEFAFPKKGSFWTQQIYDTYDKPIGVMFRLERPYAGAEYLDLYLNRLDDYMNQVRAYPTNNADKRRLVKLLAVFHHTFANALPFAKVNNSIAMAQINYVLIFHGLRGIPHGILDQLALVTSYTEFEEYFLEAVSSQNPNLGK